MERKKTTIDDRRAREGKEPLSISPDELLYTTMDGLNEARSWLQEKFFAAKEMNDEHRMSQFEEGVNTVMAAMRLVGDLRLEERDLHLRP